MIQMSINGNVIQINGRSVELDYPIKDAFVVNDRIIVLLDPDSNLGKQGQFQNLICLQPTGHISWVAELPTSLSSDVYYKVANKLPLIAYSFCSYKCEIDINTGMIKKKVFTK